MLLISTQCIAAPHLGTRLSRAGLNQGKEHNQCTVCCVFSWKVSQSSDKMKFGLLPEEPDSQVIKEVGKSGHVSYFEPAFGSAILCKMIE